MLYTWQIVHYSTGDVAMRKIILTIAIVLCAAAASADDCRWERGWRDNGHHYGEYRRQRGHECGNERHKRYVVYLPEQRRPDPRVTISLQTPGLIVSFLSGR
jgi:hypothetical protein